MAEGSGSNSGLAFVVGGLLVLVVVIGLFLMFGGGLTEKKELDVNIKAPDIQAPKVPSGG
ncbi:MAG TPA: hypothetical protein VEA44_02235 [Caulobacter sp.]|nr:hypothetical protein [Caulobacter sp.]